MTEPCVSFQAIADGLGLEGVENLTLSLSGPPNVQLTNASLHICIQDSDGKDHYNVHSLHYTSNFFGYVFIVVHAVEMHRSAFGLFSIII